MISHIFNIELCNKNKLINLKMYHSFSENKEILNNNLKKDDKETNIQIQQEKSIVFS